MTETEPASSAWEPVTPRGVAAFARATTGRLLLVQFLVALLVAVSVIYFLHDAWFPTARQAIQHLPDAGEIRSGRLDWRGSSPRVLAEGTFLAFSVDLDHSGEARSPAHVEIELGRDDFFIRSLLGYVAVRYPQGWLVALNREALGPWWGAWSPVLLAGVALGVVLWLLATWGVLAALYALPLSLLVLFANLDLKWIECWRLAGAALLPGAVLMAVGILMYNFGVVDLVGLGFVAAGHLVLGWIYLFIGPLFLRPAVASRNQNPFAAKKA